MFRKLSAPVSVQWELTPDCNLNCTHCYNFWRESSENRRHLPMAGSSPVDPDRVVDELIANKVLHVTLTGGEPLIVLKRHYASLGRLREAGIDIHINSNLVFLDDSRLAIMKDLGVKSVLTSLMSHRETLHDNLSNREGSYRGTVTGIKKLVESGIRVAVNMVVTQKNAEDVVDTGLMVAKMGVVSFCATKASKPASCGDFSEYHLGNPELGRMFTDLLQVREATGIGVDSLEHYPACAFPDPETRTVLGGRSCSAGKTGCTIGHDGLIRPCSHASQTYGHIHDGLKLAWDAMDDWRSGSLVPDFCKTECGEYPRRCGGGCRVEAENCRGSLKARDPFCVGGKPPARVPAQQPDISDGTTFVPCPGIRFRSEGNATLVYLSARLWLLVDDKLRGLLSKNEPFNSHDLALLYGVSIEKVISTLRLLVIKKLVNEASEKTEKERR